MESGQPKELALTEIMERLEFVRFFSPNSSVQTPLRVAEGDAFWTSSKGVQAQFRDSVSGTLFEVYAFIEVQNSLDGTWRDPGGDGELEISSDEINSPWRIMCRYPLHPINPSFRYFGDRHLYPFLFLDVPNGNIGEGVFSENLEIAPITSPVPRTNFGSSFRRVNGTTSTGYGVFDDRSFPWLWSENHGWWYWSATGSVARTFDAYWWVWDTQLGWLRVEEFEREFFWTGTKWYYFAGRFESGLRWFYDFSNGEWFSVE